MNDINKNLDELSIEDNYSLALLLLYRVSNNSKYAVLSDLAYVLDKDNLVRLLTYFGGKTIEIPTVKRLKSTLRTLMLYQKYKVEGLSWDEALEASGYPPEEGREAERYLTHFVRILNTTKIGNTYND